MMKPILLVLSGTAALGGCAIMKAPPEQTFFERLSMLCGRSFDGRIASPPDEADRDFAGKRIVMRVGGCTANEIRIPVAVGEDRSRTWLVRRGPGPDGAALSLHHDHRHADGSEDRLSRYGGSATSPGTASRQEFPADAFSRALFLRENNPAATANVWAMEVHPKRLFAYELRRPSRFFRLEFDLSRPLVG